MLTLAGTYEDTLFSDTSCDTLLTLILEVTDFIEVERQATICAGESYPFNGELLTLAGTYEDTVFSATSCDTLLTLILEVGDLIEMERRDTICQGEGYPFNGILLTIPGIYLDTLPSEATCDTLLTLTLEVIDLVEIVRQDTICAGENYQFYDQILTMSGDYEAIVPSETSCDSLVTLMLTVNPSPDAILSPVDTVLCETAEPFLLSVITNDPGQILSYEWAPDFAILSNPPDVASVLIDPMESSSFSVVLTNQYNCQHTLATEFPREDCSKPCIPEEVFIPSGFTPNGDMVNDELCVRTTSESDPGEISMELTIYDRWGEVVFHTNTYGDCWDGTYKGAALPQDVYVYRLTLFCPGEEPEIRIGDVVLLR